MCPLSHRNTWAGGGLPGRERREEGVVEGAQRQPPLGLWLTLSTGDGILESMTYLSPLQGLESPGKRPERTQKHQDHAGVPRGS